MWFGVHRWVDSSATTSEGDDASRYYPWGGPDHGPRAVRSVLAHLREKRGTALTAEEIAANLGETQSTESIYLMLKHAAANEDHSLKRTPGPGPCAERFAVP